MFMCQPMQVLQELERPRPFSLAAWAASRHTPAQQQQQQQQKQQHGQPRAQENDPARASPSRAEADFARPGHDSAARGGGGAQHTCSDIGSPLYKTAAPSDAEQRRHAAGGNRHATKEGVLTEQSPHTGGRSRHASKEGALTEPSPYTAGRIEHAAEKAALQTVNAEQALACGAIEQENQAVADKLSSRGNAIAHALMHTPVAGRAPGSSQLNGDARHKLCASVEPPATATSAGTLRGDSRWNVRRSYRRSRGVALQHDMQITEGGMSPRSLEGGGDHAAVARSPSWRSRRDAQQVCGRYGENLIDGRLLTTLPEAASAAEPGGLAIHGDRETVGGTQPPKLSRPERTSMSEPRGWVGDGDRAMPESAQPPQPSRPEGGCVSESRGPAGSRDGGAADRTQRVRPAGCGNQLWRSKRHRPGGVQDLWNRAAQLRRKG
jgi:hypothetical protein